MFEGFNDASTIVDGIRIHAIKGGRGPALLLLHGHPQTHAIWHKVAPTLAEHFTVIAADLRGYGDSGKPPGVARPRELFEAPDGARSGRTRCAVSATHRSR